MAGGYNVSVKLTMQDYASSKLDKITKSMDDVVRSANAYNDVLEKILVNYGKLESLELPTIKVPKLPKTTTAPTSPSGETGKNNLFTEKPFMGTEEAVVSLRQFTHNLASAKRTFSGLITAQQEFTSEISEMEHYALKGTSAIQKNYGGMADSLSNILKIEDQIASSNVIKSMPTMALGIRNTMRATENAVEGVARTYERMQNAIAKGEQVDTGQIVEASRQLETAMTKISRLQSQLQKATANGLVPESELAELQAFYDMLDAEYSNLINQQRLLFKSTREAFDDPLFIGPTVNEIKVLDKAIDSTISTNKEAAASWEEYAKALDSVYVKPVESYIPSGPVELDPTIQEIKTLDKAIDSTIGTTQKGSASWEDYAKSLDKVYDKPMESYVPSGLIEVDPTTQEVKRLNREINWLTGSMYDGKATAEDYARALDEVYDKPMVPYVPSGRGLEKFEFPTFNESVETWKKQLNGLKDTTKQAGADGVAEMRKLGQEMKSVASAAVTTNKTISNTRTLFSQLWREGYTVEADRAFRDLTSGIREAKTNIEAMKSTMKTSMRPLASELWNKGLTKEAQITIDNLKKSYDALPHPMRTVKSVSESMFRLSNTMARDLWSDTKRINTELLTMARNTQFAQSPLKTLKSTAVALGKQGASAVNGLANALSKVADKANKAEGPMDNLKSLVTQLGGVYLGVETIKTAFDWSDQLTLTEGKLSNLTDDVDGFMHKVYQMSQETRTGYMENASQMAKMWQLTGGTEGIFDEEDKLIEFNELLNKAFTLGGSGKREINASMYQLTQALSSGRLQGDELRSMSENAPYLINTVVQSIEDMYNAGKDQSEWIDLTYNDLKKLGAEGVITSDVVVGAVLSSADQIRDAFENLEPTWEQTFETLRNQAQKVSKPILKTLNDLINSEGFKTMAQSIIKAFAILMALLTPVIETIKAIGNFMADNWSIIEPIIWGIVGAFAAYYGVIMLAKTAVWLHTKALVVKEGVLKAVKVAQSLYQGALLLTGLMLGWLTGVEMENTKKLWEGVGASLSLSAATWAMLTPIIAGVAIFLAIIGVIYLVVFAYNQLTGATVSATGIIIGAFYAMYAYVYNAIASVWDILVGFAEFLANLFNDPVYTLKKLFGDLAIGVIDIWMSINDAIITVVNSVKGAINGLLGAVSSAINSVIDAYNSTLGKVLGTKDKINLEIDSTPWEESNKMLKEWKSGINTWVGEPNATPINYDEYRMGRKDIDEYYEKGYKKGGDIEKSIGDMFDTSKFLGDTDLDLSGYTSDVPGMENWVQSQPNYNQPYVDGMTELPDDITNAIDGIKGNTDDIVDMGEEELKYLRDIAEQKVINRFTTAEIKVTTNMNNNISSDRDIDGMADYFAQVLERACETTAERYNGA